MGILLTILWAIPMSYIWKPDKQLTQNPKLFTPFVRKFLKLNHVYELEELPLNGSQLKAGPELKIDLSETKKENTATI